MDRYLKQIKQHKKACIGVLTLLFIVLLIALKSRNIRIIDQYSTLMRSSSKKYPTRTLAIINKIVVHHSASIGQYAADYARYHVQSKGWAGIGYHFVIEKNGDIIQGNPLRNVSNNVAGENRRSIGICLSGDFTKEQPSSQQLKSLAQLIKYLRKQLPQSLEVYGHRDFGQTSCPGHQLAKHLYKFKLA